MPRLIFPKEQVVGQWHSRQRRNTLFKGAIYIHSSLTEGFWRPMEQVKSVHGDMLDEGERHMRLISVNVGLPREVTWKGKPVTTAIFKEAVQGPILLRTLNLDGDRQADLSVHGGADKAVYVYPTEHYDYWRSELSGQELPWGSFGENFTTTGLLEGAVHLGDRFSIGSVEVVVTQPRLPCYKLGIKFGQADMVKRFSNSQRTGFYLAVRKEGIVAGGDAIQLLSRDPQQITVADVTRLYLRDDKDLEKMRRALQSEALPEGWRTYFTQQLEQTEL
jgi:MOSC domain-containing protein YiiM